MTTRRQLLVAGAALAAAKVIAASDADWRTAAPERYHHGAGADSLLAINSAGRPMA